jgi:hypothetical protein
MSTRIKKRNNLDSITYLTTVKTEYEKQLTNILVKPLYKMISNIYSDCKRHCEKYKKRDIMKQFQSYLSKVSGWDKESKIYYTNKIVNDASCSYLDKLLSAVFISSTKLLSATASKKKYDINVVIPDVNVFLYKVLRNSARQCYTNPYLFCDYDISPWDRQRNLRDALNLIEEEIKNTLRASLPFDEILDSYLAQLDEESEDEEEEYDTRSMTSDVGSLLAEEEQIEIEDLDEDDEEEQEDVVSEHSEHSDHEEEDINPEIFNEEMLEGDEEDISEKISESGSEVLFLEEMKGDERFSFMPLVEKKEKKSYEEILKEEQSSKSGSESDGEEKAVKVNKKSLDGTSNGKKYTVSKEKNDALFDDVSDDDI